MIKSREELLQMLAEFGLGTNLPDYPRKLLVTFMNDNVGASMLYTQFQTLELFWNWIGAQVGVSGAVHDVLIDGLRLYELFERVTEPGGTSPRRIEADHVTIYTFSQKGRRKVVDCTYLPAGSHLLITDAGVDMPPYATSDMVAHAKQVLRDELETEKSCIKLLKHKVEVREKRKNKLLAAYNQIETELKSS